MVGNTDGLSGARIVVNIIIVWPALDWATGGVKCGGATHELAGAAGQIMGEVWGMM